MKDLNPGVLAPESMSTPRCGAASPSSPYTMFCDGKYEDTCSPLTEEHTLGDLKTIFFSSPRKAIQAPFPFPTLIFTFISRRELHPWGWHQPLHYTTKIQNRPARASFPLRVNARSLPLEGLPFWDDVGSHLWEMEAGECRAHGEFDCASREQGSRKRPRLTNDPKTESKTGFLMKAALQLGWKQESKLGAGEATQSQVSLGNTTQWTRLVCPAPRNAQALTVLLDGTWTNSKGFLKPPSKLAWTKKKPSVNISYHNSQNGIQMGHQVLYTKLNQLKPPRMNNSKKASSEGKTVSEAWTARYEDPNLHHCATCLE